MIDVQQAAAPVPTATPAHYDTRGRAEQLGKLDAERQAKCGPAARDEVIVCGNLDNDRYRLKPLADDYPVQNFLNHPFHIPIAPGVALDGLSLSVKFGPNGRSPPKSDAPRPNDYSEDSDQTTGPVPQP